MSQKRSLPVDISLPENTPLDGGAMFVRLPTLDALEIFWTERRREFHFAAKGILYGDQQTFLNEYEWVFAPTKASLVKAFTRWNQIGIVCEWYDWAGDTSQDVGIQHAQWFRERDYERASAIANGSWREEDEQQYQEDVRVRTPETYRGWWTLKNLPSDLDWSDGWFGPFDAVEIIDPTLSVEAVAERMQQLTYDSWHAADSGDIAVMDASGVDEEIAYWRGEQRNGAGYYGEENV